VRTSCRPVGSVDAELKQQVLRPSVWSSRSSETWPNRLGSRIRVRLCYGNALRIWFGAHSIGLDYVPGHVEWATARATNNSLPQLFCLADQEQLNWLPTEYFDHALSVAVVMYVRGERTVHRACAVVGNVLRSLKPGGHFYFGWNTHVFRAPSQFEQCEAILSAAEMVKPAGVARYTYATKLFKEGSQDWCGECAHGNMTGYRIRKTLLR
jgi:SAM-dependent methyltransferase